MLLSSYEAIEHCSYLMKWTSLNIRPQSGSQINRRTWRQTDRLLKLPKQRAGIWDRQLTVETDSWEVRQTDSWERRPRQTAETDSWDRQQLGQTAQPDSSVTAQTHNTYIRLRHTAQAAQTAQTAAPTDCSQTDRQFQQLRLLTNSSESTDSSESSDRQLR